MHIFIRLSSHTAGTFLVRSIAWKVATFGIAAVFVAPLVQSKNLPASTQRLWTARVRCSSVTQRAHDAGGQRQHSGNPEADSWHNVAEYSEQQSHDDCPDRLARQPCGTLREVGAIVGGYAAALALARASDLVATVHERHTGILFAGMHSFSLPLQIPQFTLSLLWHPRLDGDQAHRWLRGCVRETCAGTLEG
jgi:DNA-binding transcriptional LysR family regulator